VLLVATDDRDRPDQHITGGGNRDGVLLAVARPYRRRQQGWRSRAVGRQSTFEDTRSRKVWRRRGRRAALPQPDAQLDRGAA
jgi:hypothetical protein